MDAEYKSNVDTLDLGDIVTLNGPYTTYQPTHPAVITAA